MVRKFNVGDKVQITAPHDADFLKFGRIVAYEKSDHTDSVPYLVKILYKRYLARLYYGARELKLIKKGK